jgi:hypothetical protein
MAEVAITLSAPEEGAQSFGAHIFDMLWGRWMRINNEVQSKRVPFVRYKGVYVFKLHSNALPCCVG